MIKNLLRFAIGGVLLTGVASVGTNEEAHGWSTIGGMLGQGQRDFRIYNDFQDAATNDNTTADPNWPGYDGAELAIWKGGAEWGSRLFGDGTGDPTQSGDIGSGKANFNFFWNGNASGVGGTNDNINSPLGGASGGVLAFTETPINNGWRIRYYEDWTWEDGPGTFGGSAFDLQAVACHELGHALGLGHSTDNAATMAPSIAQNSEGERSINADDQDGIQLGIYDARDDNNLPRIADLTGSVVAGGTVVLTGANLDAGGETNVWLNSDLVDGGDAGGEPYIISGLTAINGGTEVSFVVPSSGIEPGGVHVDNGKNGRKFLSEGHPFPLDTSGTGCGGTDTVGLTGPAQANAGDFVSFTITGAPNSPFTLYRSFNLLGTIINGQQFDIGDPVVVVGTGMTDATGTGVFSGTVPANIALTVFLWLEAGVDDNGTFCDSNAIQFRIN